MQVEPYEIPSRRGDDAVMVDQGISESYCKGYRFFCMLNNELRVYL
jgi:hypothetical protein